MMLDNCLLVQNLNKELSIGLPETASGDTIREKLYSYISYLIDKYFEKLVLILYRIDVHEEKLKKLLNESPTLDASVVIGNLIIERQLQKIKNREEFSQPVENISEEDKW